MGIDVEMENMTLPIIVINLMACLKDWRDSRKFPTHFTRTAPFYTHHCGKRGQSKTVCTKNSYTGFIKQILNDLLK